MDLVRKLSREVQVVLGGTVLYLVFSFLHWQQVSAFGITVGNTEWVGIGVVAGLVAIALLVWEALRIVQPELRIGAFAPGLVSVTLALVLLLFTVITFLTHNEARHWPSWLGLILSAVVAFAALVRGRSEGVEMPQFGKPRTPLQH